jgi:nicotinate-nucleotide adenylyltransferase
MTGRILVFGGSFDPPHYGHAAILKAAIQKIKPDLVLVVPSYQSPWKKKAGASAQERVQMARLAFPFARVDDCEAQSGRRVYTVETLERIARLRPGAEIYFALGSDLSARFSDWKNPKRLQTLAHWWAAARPGKKHASPDFFRKIPGIMPSVSSSDLRVRLLMGENVVGSLSPKVLNFIRSRGLYGMGVIPELKKMLEDRRFLHSLSVASLAQRLALVWGVDLWSAALAGLLHDAGRSVPVAKMPSYFAKRGLKIPLLKKMSERQPLLLHAYISADLARRRFDVQDPEILRAISNHTLAGHPMGLLERLIYVADACSEDRAYSSAASLRKLALKNPAAAFKECLLVKIRYALSQGGWIHPGPISVWNSLIEQSS